MTLESEYDQHFLNDREAWKSPQRDNLACAIIKAYLSPEIILDIGCGNGHTLEMMSTLFPTAKLHGIDLSGEAVKIAQARLPGANIIKSTVETYRPDLLPDLTLAMGTAEHFVDLDYGLKCLKALTGGICYLEVPNNLKYSPGAHEYRRLERGSRQMEWHLSRDEWEAHIRRAGFVILRPYTGPSSVYEFIWVLR